MARTREATLLVRTKNAADLLDSSPETLRYWVRKGLLTAVHIGRAVYFERSELERFVRSQRHPKTTARQSKGA
jgi:excisionase family DNA binding protein